MIHLFFLFQHHQLEMGHPGEGYITKCDIKEKRTFCMKKYKINYCYYIMSHVTVDSPTKFNTQKLKLSSKSRILWEGVHTKTGETWVLPTLKLLSPKCM